MERLTIYTGDGYESLDPVDLQLDEYSDINFSRLVNKLGQYEDAEEQGLLIRLTCKVGDMVYVLEPCHCYNDYKENQNCHHAKTKASKYIEVVRKTF